MRSFNGRGFDSMNESGDEGSPLGRRGNQKIGTVRGETMSRMMRHIHVFRPFKFEPSELGPASTVASASKDH